MTFCCCATPGDVLTLCYSPVTSQTEAEVPGRPVYLLADISWGAFRDVQARFNKYWYWGGLKERMAYVFGVFKSEATNGEDSLCRIF